ncbi:peptide ABC transporter substrate-binding protein [Kroppenstedtia sanguinis]|uniref:Peptide ABC transporter substrate-binding protein n=3 Tax=Kroppenstedtia sanguinis TaxID=1380684 RepID=A0ABW4C9E3_9BACL
MDYWEGFFRRTENIVIWIWVESSDGMGHHRLVLSDGDRDDFDPDTDFKGVELVMGKGISRGIALLVVCSMAFLAACGGGSSAGKGGKGKLAEDQEITLGNIPSEPPGLDPMEAKDSVSGDVLSQTMVGLTKMDKKGKPVPGLAEKWDANEDMTQITFHLRDAQWSNGDPVTAEDFEYAWKRMLDPKNGAVYAYQLFYLKNGEKYNKGEAKSEEVGVKAVDDKTLEVQLEQPTPYFLGLTTFYSLKPVPKKVVEKNKDWASEADSYVCNGPFKVKSWKHDSKIVLEKNDKYYDADKVKLTQINMPFIAEQKTGYQMFQTGDVDSSNSNIVPADLTKKLLDSGEAKGEPQIATYTVEFNTKKKPFNNKKVRKAFSMAIDRKQIVENVLEGGQEPANGWVPWGMPDFAANKDFAEVHGKYIEPTAQADEAKKLLEEGLKEEGLKKMPEMTYLYNTDEGHKKIAEALQQMWKKNLGVNVKLGNVEWKVFIERKTAGDYDFARFGWLPDYIDPMTFMDVYMTDSGNNDPKYSNKKFDGLIEKAKSTADQKVRMQALHEAEDILMDEMPVAPLYWYTRVYMDKDYVKNVYRALDGSVFYEDAYLLEK